MSTMYDALKKAEAEHKKTLGFVEKSPESNNFSDDSKSADNTKVIFLSIAVIIVFAIGIYRFFGAQIMGVIHKPAVAQEVKAVPATPAAAGTTASTTAKPKRAPGTYGLDGVIDAGANSMAIVNGQLMKVGDKIDKLILKKISPQEVELLNTKDNTTVILQIE